MKKQRKKNLLAFVVCGSLFIAGVILTGAIRIPQDTPSVRAEASRSLKRVETHLQTTVAEYRHKKKTDEWLLNDCSEMFSQEQRQLCAEFRASLLHAANQWCPTNALGMQIKRWLPEWSLGIVNGRRGTSGNVNIVTVLGGNDMLVLVPRSFNKESDPLSFCNTENDGEAVMLKACKMPLQISSAIVLHEIGHAEHYWRQKRPAGHPEEVVMHTLSYEILNAYSSGKYRQCLITLLDTKLDPRKDYREMFGKLSEQDLETLDSAIDAKEVGREVASCVVMQHLLSLGFEAIERTGGTLEDKASLYEWLNIVAGNPF